MGSEPTDSILNHGRQGCQRLNLQFWQRIESVRGDVEGSIMTDYGIAASHIFDEIAAVCFGRSVIIWGEDTH